MLPHQILTLVYFMLLVVFLGFSGGLHKYIIKTLSQFQEISFEIKTGED